MEEIGIIVAVLAGVGSFTAPCILPMIPAFLAYISGTTLSEANSNPGTVLVSTPNVVLNAMFFVMGFSIVFSIAGVAINVLIDPSYQEGGSSWGLNQAGGLIIIGFGAFMLFSSRIARLNAEKRIIPKMRGASYPMSFVFGLAFATGWTPCIGPVLGAILTLAAATPATAFNLLLAYSAGLGIPFVLMAAFLPKASRLVGLMRKHFVHYSVIVGILIMVLGVLVFFNQLAYVASFPMLNDVLLMLLLPPLLPMLPL